MSHAFLDIVSCILTKYDRCPGTTSQADILQLTREIINISGFTPQSVWLHFPKTLSYTPRAQPSLVQDPQKVGTPMY